MTNCKLTPLLLILFIAGCSGVSDIRPEPIRKSEYFLEHGVTAFENSDYVAATDFLNKALAHYRSIDNPEGIILSHINLTETALAAGNFTAAEEHITAAVNTTRESDSRHFLPRLNLLLAQTYWRRHEVDKALQLLAVLLPSFNAEQTSESKPDLLALGATIIRTDIAFFFIEKDAQEARLWLRRLSLMIPSVEGNTQLHEARLLRFEARLSILDNNPKKALEKFTAALELYRDSAARPAIASTLTEIAKLQIKLKLWQNAETTLNNALYIRLWIMDKAGAKQVMRLLSATYMETGQEKKAKEINSEIERINERES